MIQQTFVGRNVGVYAVRQVARERVIGIAAARGRRFIAVRN